LSVLFISMMHGQANIKDNRGNKIVPEI
jgi:hypothetical protein